MSAVDLPAEVPAIPVLRSLPSEAGMVGNDLRTVGVDLQNVQEWADRGAAPKSWKGSAAEAAAHARTRFARRVDVAEAAVQLATVATVRFEDRLARLLHRRHDLDHGRTGLNEDIARTRIAIEKGELIDGPAQQTAARLRARATRLRDDISAWHTGVQDAQTDFIAALARIDTVPEARDVAGHTDLPDTGGLMRRLHGLQGHVAAMTQWWRSLTRTQREALMLAYPGIVGSTLGIPITGRDRANRAHIGALRGYLRQRDLDGQLGADDKKALSNLDALQEQIDGYRHNVDPVTGRNLMKVIQYDPYAYDGDGSSVISLGNPDTARHIASYTPGFTTLGGKADGMAQVGALYGAMRGHGARAVILYDGYDAPDPSGLTSGDPAKMIAAAKDAAGVAGMRDGAVGGHHLAGFLNGLDSTRHPGGTTVTVIGHSYGNEVVQSAVVDGAHVDDVVALADPGAPGTDVHDLVGNSRAQMYVGSDDHDPVSLLGRGPAGGLGTLGSDPAAASYGAHRIAVPTGPADLDGVVKMGNHASGHYLSGEGLRNVATIATGGRPTEIGGRTDTNYQPLSELLGQVAVNSTHNHVDDFVYSHGGGSTVRHVASAAGNVARATHVDALVHLLTG